jgi:serine/threonine protein kinase/Tol biopolymer transport system component
MALETGARIDIYEVTGKLGEGAMGEVYRARDTTLDRDVALKVLPDSFTADPERLGRFQREAKVLASLNHPNIGGIYGLETSGDNQALVLELIEGPTLAERIAEGPIPVEQGLAMVRQIAEALSAAHDAGVVHRDLKPANIKVRADGTVKVLDFGLAKAVEGGATGSGSSDAATMTAMSSQAGAIIGTAAYMSPEQARGQDVDKRSDIWALGCVAYELLTGHRPFEGSTLSDTLASVLARDVDWSRLPDDVPPALHKFLTRCLEKDATKRLRDAAEGILQLEDGLAQPVVEAPEPVIIEQTPLKVWQQPAVAAGVSALIAITASTTVYFSVSTPPNTNDIVTRFALPMPGDDVTDGGDGFALSPDGETLVYAATRGGVQSLFARPRDQLEPRLLPGTEGAVNPFYSPDGEWVGYFTQNSVMKVSLSGGPPVTLCPAGLRQGATWSENDTILFSSNLSDGIMQVPAAGGEPRLLTEPAEENQRHLWPSFVPASNVFIYTSGTGNEISDKTLFAMSLDTGEQKELVQGTMGSVTSSGHLVFARESSLWSVAFNAETLSVEGEPAPIVEGVQVNAGNNWAHYATAHDGTLIYLPAGVGFGSGIDRRMVWVSRSGEPSLVDADPATYSEFDLSPTGSSVAVSVISPEGRSVWVYDFERNTNTRLTFGDDGQVRSPAWTSDSFNIAFGTENGVFWKASNGTGAIEQLTETGGLPFDFTLDDEGLIFGQGFRDVGLINLSAGSETVELFTDPGFIERNATLSRDGRWLAYQSNESGTHQVYVRPYPDIESGRWQISTDGGVWPRWHPTEDELFYRGPTGMMSLQFSTDPTFTAGNLTELFRWPFAGSSGILREMDVHPDGQRFLLLTGDSSQTDTGVSSSSSLNVVLNWFNELTERVPIS